MADPIQQFIQNYMGFQGFMEEQRQFDQQSMLQERELENTEITNYAALLSRVKNPQEAGAIGEFFAARNPQLAPVFQTLTQGVTASLDTQLAAANATRSPEEILLGIRMREGQALTASDQQRGQQFQQTFGEDVRQFDRTFEENKRQFGLEYAERVRSTNLNNALGWGQQNLGWANHRQNERQLTAQSAYQMGTLDVQREEARARRAAAGRGQTMDPLELMDMSRKAWTDMQRAKTPAEKQGFLDVIRFSTGQLRGMGVPVAEPGGSPTDVTPPQWYNPFGVGSAPSWNQAWQRGGE